MVFRGYYVFHDAILECFRSDLLHFFNNSQSSKGSSGFFTLPFSVWLFFQYFLLVIDLEYVFHVSLLFNLFSLVFAFHISISSTILNLPMTLLEFFLFQIFLWFFISWFTAASCWLNWLLFQYLLMVRILQFVFHDFIVCGIVNFPLWIFPTFELPIFSATNLNLWNSGYKNR